VVYDARAALRPLVALAILRQYAQFTLGMELQMTQSGEQKGGPAKPATRRRVMIHGLSPTRKPMAGVETEAEEITPSPQAPPIPFRIGHGYDIHRLEHGRAGGKLVLAGVTVSEEIAPIAHSDGDVILHAIVDALLGAMGMGDIGEIFGNADPQWKDAASKIFVDEIYGRVRDAGYRLTNLDVSLLLERPKILPHKPAMLTNLRRLFGPSAAVNIKAGTNEECDAVGRGEAVVAHAVVLLSAAH
jgi:2-C-methyl-D-erythritol 2,4-cyclodiphosphate synthase